MKGADTVGEEKSLPPREENAVLENEEALPAVYRLRPAFKDYLWGGTRLRDVFHKDTPYETTAESWELSAHPDGPSVILGGPFDGMPFDAFIEPRRRTLCGTRGAAFSRFPVLIKLIDTAKPLSLQIHPDDAYALQHEKAFGKTEVWYVLEAARGACFYCGLSRDTEKDELRQRIENGTLTEVLNRISARPGDVILVPAGTIHAIGEGILIVEIQQSSNITYRVYDYDRIDVNGKKRPLQIEKALDVVNTRRYPVRTGGPKPPVKKDGYSAQEIARCAYFQCTRYAVERTLRLMADDTSFLSVLVLSGKAQMTVLGEDYALLPGDSFFITAGEKPVLFTGTCEVLITKV